MRGSDQGVEVREGVLKGRRQASLLEPGRTQGFSQLLPPPPPLPPACLPPAPSPTLLPPHLQRGQPLPPPHEPRAVQAPTLAKHQQPRPWACVAQPTVSECGGDWRGQGRKDSVRVQVEQGGDVVGRGKGMVEGGGGGRGVRDKGWWSCRGASAVHPLSLPPSRSPPPHPHPHTPYSSLPTIGHACPQSALHHSCTAAHAGTPASKAARVTGAAAAPCPPPTRSLPPYQTPPQRWRRAQAALAEVAAGRGGLAGGCQTPPPAGG